MENTNPSINNVVTLEPGEYLIREKTRCDAVYVIKEGQLEVSRVNNDGQKIPIGMISSGQWAGEAALFLDQMHGASVMALTPVKAAKLPRSYVENALKSVPSWLVSMTKGAFERLQGANETLRRNGWVDEGLALRINAIEEKFKKTG
jgi:CRP-like cAMP-binding protein